MSCVDQPISSHAKGDADIPSNLQQIESLYCRYAPLVAPRVCFIERRSRLRASDCYEKDKSGCVAHHPESSAVVA
jgi:hypothetical protein